MADIFIYYIIFISYLYLFTDYDKNIIPIENHKSQTKYFLINYTFQNKRIFKLIYIFKKYIKTKFYSFLLYGTSMIFIKQCRCNIKISIIAA